MSETLQFATRIEFRSWLGAAQHQLMASDCLFGKQGGSKTLKATEALEEALCFGWIDGLMKSLDESFYVKYFAARRPNSK